MAAVLEQVIKRDRMVVGFALAAITALAWIYLLRLDNTMGAAASMPNMPGMPGMKSGPASDPLAPTTVLLTVLMWAVMMVGMMIPSASPMILLYARVARHARGQGQAFAATGWFAAGYVLAWTGFAMVAGVAQSGLSAAALITPMMSSANSFISGAILIAAGLYQWTPLKMRCLTQCQTPLAFLQRHGGFRRDATGALAIGLTHGLYCVGCCWALMTLLFVGGVMNLFLVAGLSIFVLIEKLAPAGVWLGRGAGLIFAAAGAGIIYGQL